VNGEYTAHYLAENRHKSLDIEALKHPESQTLQLLENTYKWLGEISSGISISASADASTQSAKLTYQYEYGGNTTSNYSPLNVGFGLTYVLPVIVLILKAKPGDFIIVENPESHLHPAGQAKIADNFSSSLKNRPNFAWAVRTLSGKDNSLKTEKSTTIICLVDCPTRQKNFLANRVETHSDHFLNGVRVATKNKVIAPDKSQIYFFEKQKDSLDTNIE
jgi:predicted ATPase